MILLIDTSSSICKLTLYFNKENIRKYGWDSGRLLARDLLGFLRDKIEENSKSWSDIDGIGVYKGPGSFTGLRIGLTIMNTVADSESIPIVGAIGDNWQEEALVKLNSNINEKIVMPFYGGEVNITKPKK